MFGAKKSTRRLADASLYRFEKLLFPCFHMFAVTAHELVNTSCSVHQFGFTSVERVRSVRDLKFVDRVLIV